MTEIDKTKEVRQILNGGGIRYLGFGYFRPSYVLLNEYTLIQNWIDF